MLLIYEGILTVTLNSQGRDSEVIGQPVNRLKVTPKTLTHIKPTIRASYSTRRYSNVAYTTQLWINRRDPSFVSICHSYYSLDNHTHCYTACKNGKTLLQSRTRKTVGECADQQHCRNRTGCKR